MKKFTLLFGTPKEIIKDIRRKIKERFGFDPFPKKIPPTILIY